MQLLNMDSIAGQSQILRFWEKLDDAQRKALAEQLSHFNIPFLNDAFQKSLVPVLPQPGDISQIEPDRYVDRELLSPAKISHLWDLGLKAIAEGRVATVVMAGGQASRLGVDKPKGALKLGTGFSQTKTDSLFFIQAAQIVRLITLAKQKYPDLSPSILWLVMTSESTYAETNAHLRLVAEETGLNLEDVIIFNQNQVPCYDFEGRILMLNEYTLATSPDGGGGIYHALQPLLPELERRGVNFFHVYCVDNILCRVADPYFVGCAIEKGADCAAKVVEKKHPSEAVGHVCKVNGQVRVIEYSEIPPELAELVDPSNGKLFLRAGSIANHLFSLEFLREVCANADALPFHAARKKIPHLDLGTGKFVSPAEPNGIKLERFIFDAFSYSKNFLVWQVPTDEEFSPLKNADSAGCDCLATCLRSLHSDHAKWLRDACTFASLDGKTTT